MTELPTHLHERVAELQRERRAGRQTTRGRGTPAASARVLYRLVFVVAAAVSGVLWLVAAGAVILVTTVMSATRLPGFVAYIADPAGTRDARADVGDALFDFVPMIALANAPVTAAFILGWLLYRHPRLLRRARAAMISSLVAGVLVSVYAHVLGGRPL